MKNQQGVYKGIASFDLETTIDLKNSTLALQCVCTDTLSTTEYIV